MRKSLLKKVYIKNHTENSLKAFKKLLQSAVKKKERNFSVY